MYKGYTPNHVSFGIIPLVYKRIKKKRKEIGNFLTFIVNNVKSINRIEMYDEDNWIIVNIEMKKHYKNYFDSYWSKQLEGIIKILSQNYYNIPFKINIYDTNLILMKYFELNELNV